MTRDKRGEVRTRDEVVMGRGVCMSDGEDVWR